MAAAIVPAIMPAAEVPMEPVETLVDKLVPRRGVGIWWAPSFTGKSLGALYFGLSLTSGNDFFYRKVKRGQVVYAAGEGESDFGQRMEALIRWSTPDTAPPAVPYSERNLWTMFGEWPLTSDEHVTAVISQLKELVKTTPDAEKDPEPLRAVIFDTIQRFSVGSTQRWSDHAQRIMAGAKKISEELDTFVLLVHHADASGKQMAGSKNFFNMADWVLHQDGDGEKGTLTIEKNKGLPPNPPMLYKLTPMIWNDPFTGKLVETVYFSPEVPPELRQQHRETMLERREAVRRVQLQIGDWLQANPGKTIDDVESMMVTAGYSPDKAREISQIIVRGNLAIEEPASKILEMRRRQQRAIAAR